MVNKAIIVGHVGADPEVRYTGDASNGAKVATMRVATTERYKDKDGVSHKTVELRADNVYFADSKPAANNEQTAPFAVPSADPSEKRAERQARKSARQPASKSRFFRFP